MKANGIARQEDTAGRRKGGCRLKQNTYKWSHHHAYL